jgi:hypothetical protein
LEGGALSTAEFREFAKDLVLFCHITTRVPGDKYQSLLHAVGGKGFPTLVFMDGMGKVVGEVDVLEGPTVALFKAVHANVKRRLALLEKEKLTDADRVEMFLLDYELGFLEIDAAKERRESLPKLDEAAAKKVAAVMANLEVADHLNPRPRGAEAARETGKAFHAMAKAGRIPTKKSLVGAFWTYMFAWAQGAKDVKAAKMIVGEVKKLAETDPQWKSILARCEKQLAAMEAAAK